MKTLLLFGVVPLLLVLSCTTQEEEAAPALSASKFIFSLQSESPEELVTTVTIEDAAGNVVIDHQSFLANPDNGNFSTAYLTLPVGKYVLTEFSVSSRKPGGKEFHAAEKSDGSTSTIEAITLPYTFTVSNNARSVIDLKTLKPGKGKTKFRVEAYVPTESGPRLTTATAYIMRDDVVIETYQLDSATNKLSYSARESGTYELVIVKTGHASFRTDLSPTKNQLITAVLTPAFTMKLNIPSANLRTFSLYLVVVNGGTINVDWGDGSTDSYTSDLLTAFTLEREYEPGIYTVSITGDLDHITGFDLFHQTCPEEIDFHALTGLEAYFMLRMGCSPAIIDLSNKPDLTVVALNGLPGLEWVLLPERHKIYHMGLTQSLDLSTAAVDSVIHNIYTNAVATNITNGFISVSGSLGDPTLPEFVGPPSESGMEELRKLRDELNWKIDPVID